MINVGKDHNTASYSVLETSALLGWYYTIKNGYNKLLKHFCQGKEYTLSALFKWKKGRP